MHKRRGWKPSAPALRMLWRSEIRVYVLAMLGVNTFQKPLLLNMNVFLSVPGDRCRFSRIRENTRVLKVFLLSKGFVSLMDGRQGFSKIKTTHRQRVLHLIIGV